MIKLCIIISGKINNKSILAKNRDRNYNPLIKIVKRIINGILVSYLLDTITGWALGMNLYGIGIVNTALMVLRDLKLGKKGHPRTVDGSKVVKSLLYKTLLLCKDSIIKSNLNGHTFISDGKNVYIVLKTVEHKAKYKKLLIKLKLWVVRTNHGYFYADAGYTKGLNLLSSKLRKRKALLMLGKVLTEGDIGSGIQHKYGLFNSNFLMNRDTDNMKTTSHYIFNLDNLTFRYYNKDLTTKFDGVDDRLPKDYKSKIKVIVLL